jgi:hypothetical protein
LNRQHHSYPWGYQYIVHKHNDQNKQKNYLATTNPTNKSNLKPPQLQSYEYFQKKIYIFYSLPTKPKVHTCFLNQKKLEIMKFQHSIRQFISKNIYISF